MSARIVVTGGSGFLGSLLARRLLRGPVALGGAAPADVAELTLVDLVPPPADVAADARVRIATGPLDGVLEGEADAVFHLAGVVSGAAEADFDLGMRTNIDGTRAVLAYGRRHSVAPLVVITSSLAGLRVFAGYAGWGPEQLRDEIAEGSWYVVSGDDADVFAADTTMLWRDVLRRQPGMLAWHSTRPADPELN